MIKLAGNNAMTVMRWNVRGNLWWISSSPWLEATQLALRAQKLW